MKFFAVAALVGLVAAQTLSSLPQCGQVCINNMLKAAPQLGCPPKNNQPDAICLCQNVDFANGIRDCVTESCPTGTNTTSIIAYGVAYCDAALANATAITTSAILTTITSDSKTITSTVGSTTIFAAGAAGHSGETAITTKPIVSTESNGSKTTIGTTTVYSSITASSSKASEASKSASASSEASKSASASSVASSAEASASSVASSASSAASSVAASASSAAASSASSSAGAMPMVTVAAQAFVGLAGLAAAFAL